MDMGVIGRALVVILECLLDRALFTVATDNRDYPVVKRGLINIPTRYQTADNK